MEDTQFPPMLLEISGADEYWFFLSRIDKNAKKNLYFREGLNLDFTRFRGWVGLKKSFLLIKKIKKDMF